MNPKDVVLPTNDLAFRKVFASNENKHILKGLIKDFFALEPQGISIESPYSIESMNRIISQKKFFTTIVDGRARGRGFDTIDTPGSSFSERSHIMDNGNTK